MTSLDETMTTSNRRERVPLLDSEVEEVTNLREQLNELMRERLDEMEPIQARNLYMRAKERYKEYTKKARVVMRRLIQRGRRNDSEDCRIDVINFTDDLKGLRVLRKQSTRC